MWVSENKIGKERGCCCAPIIITKFVGGEGGRFLWGNFQIYKMNLYVLFCFLLWKNENEGNIFMYTILSWMMMYTILEVRD